MEGFINTEIGWIPENWEEKRVDDLFSIQQGKQVSKKNRIGHNQVSFLRTANVFWGEIDLKVLDKMHFKEQEEKKFKLQHGDLLVCEGGDVGRTAIWKCEIKRIYYQNHLYRLRPLRDLSPDFYLFWLWHGFKNGVYYGRGNVTTIPNMSKSRLSKLELPFLPIEEQKSIARMLSTIRQAIEKQQALIDHSTELKKSLMHKLFTEGIKGETQKKTEIGLIPKSWDVFELRTIAIFFLGGGTPSTKINDYWNGAIPWITSKWLNEDINLRSGEKQISENGLEKSATNIIPKNNLIFATRVGVGKVGINELDLAINQDLAGAIIDKKKYNLTFLAYQYLTDRNQKEIDSYKRGATIKGITRENLKDTKFAIPNIEEQIEIAGVLLSVVNKIRNHIKKKTALEALFKTMLHELMTGKIRVKDIKI